MKIVVGMSGGVDSAVAAWLLQQEGHEVISVFMRNWDETDESGVCTAETDAADARAVCERLQIAYYPVNFAREYRQRVFDTCLAAFQQGFTPNPDVLCNREIKFDLFLDFAKKLGADAMATGHYCRTENGQLLRGLDAKKDQSYFLYMVKSHQLAFTRFPLGAMTKPEVRAIARREHLPVAEKKDSTGVCFIGERDFALFLKGFLPATSGKVKTPDGKTVGEHDGVMFYTLGQRRGLGLGGAGSRWFVVGKDIAKNILYVDRNPNSAYLASTTQTVSDISWVGESPVFPLHCTAQYRYRQPDQPVTVELVGDTLEITSDTVQRAVTPGQSVVLYQNETCLGGGIITTTNAPAIR